jgi:hypothetical protein
MDKVQKPSNSEYYTLSSELFRIYIPVHKDLLVGYVLGLLFRSEDGSNTHLRDAARI